MRQATSFSSGGSEVEVAQHAVKFTKQARKLSHRSPSDASSSLAVKAHFVTPQDPVLETSDAERLPGVPLPEAHKLNSLCEELSETLCSAQVQDGHDAKNTVADLERDKLSQEAKLAIDGLSTANQEASSNARGRSAPSYHTHPLFPPMPLYGPPSILRNFQCLALRVSSFFLSLAFISTIVLCSLATSVIPAGKKLLYKLALHNIDEKRPFYSEEMRRKKMRHEAEQAWRRRQAGQGDRDQERAQDFPPTEGGRNPIVCDVSYYARRVGLDVEEFKVQTEDGFIIDLWHVYDPREHNPLEAERRQHRGPETFDSSPSQNGPEQEAAAAAKRPKFPVLLMHGLLQSSGAYCVNDDDSLAFWLCKSGFDVWLGNNRCGFKPKHVLLNYADPRMWCWNIRQMGVFDLTALTSRVLHETGFRKIGLVCHSQGTTQALVALAKEQRPELGDRLTVFCALAPAAYAGPLIGKTYFKFMRLLSPTLFRIVFGIHAFIPFMMQMHGLLPPRLYGWLGYKVFSYLFDWSDARWDRGLRNRMFQFSPVYVSAESMRWWLGREGFAKHKCILATKEATMAEELAEDSNDDAGQNGEEAEEEESRQRSDTAWYNEQAPPIALWICGRDDLVDGARLLRRLSSGRESHVRIVHAKTIDEYEHLDVIWAMDAVYQVFQEVRQVLWRTCDMKEQCRLPNGCEAVALSTPKVASGTS